MKKIRENRSGLEFDSIEECLKYFDISRRTLLRYINTPAGIKRAYMFEFEFIDDGIVEKLSNKKD